MATASNDLDMRLSAYDYELPKELIAQRPVMSAGLGERRCASRLMVYDQRSGEVCHTTFEHLLSHLPASSHLLFNRSKVFPCRLPVSKVGSGGKAEIFFLSMEPVAQHCYQVMVKSNGAKRIGDQWHVDQGPRTYTFRLVDRSDNNQVMVLDCGMDSKQLQAFLFAQGKIPIPHYIRSGLSDQQDALDYQTVYAQEVGSTAAPTAGLHFDQSLLDKLKQHHHKCWELCLHVGLGTFRPITTDNILEHNMHQESFSISSQLWDHFTNKADPGSIIAVGTTSLRALEGARRNPRFQADCLERTDIFLHPGAEPVAEQIGGLITNFHLPKSSLLMLVSHLIGREKCLELYQQAIAERYRFFSYGDGMLILLDRNE